MTNRDTRILWVLVRSRNKTVGQRIPIFAYYKHDGIRVYGDILLLYVSGTFRSIIIYMAKIGLTCSKKGDLEVLEESKAN